jgi:hypothetical protein
MMYQDDEELLALLKGSLIPQPMHAGIVRYVMHGIKPGKFLSALFANNLREAVVGADDENLGLLIHYVRFVYNDCPSFCHGSPENFDDWISLGGLVGRALRSAQS